MKKFISTLIAITLCLASTTIVMAEGTTAEVTAAEVTNAEVTQKLYPSIFSGKIVEKTDDRIELQSTDGNNNLVLNISAETYIVDAVSGVAMPLKDSIDDNIVAYYGPMTTLSIPPQSNAVLIMCNLPQDYVPPTYVIAESVEETSNNVRVLVEDSTLGQLYVLISDETELSPYKTKNIVRKEQIKENSELLIWKSSAVASSFPPQVSAVKAVLLGTKEVVAPEEPEEVTPIPTPIVQAQTYELNSSQFYIKNDVTMIPLRSVAEEFGYSVTWNAQGSSITITKDNDTHTLVLNQNSYDSIQLETAPEIKNDRTYVPVSYFEKIIGGTQSTSDESITLTK